MISKEKVLKIAKLARLELSEKEVEKMQKDLSAILDYFELLKKAPQLKEHSHILENVRMLKFGRADEVAQNHSVDKIMQEVPDKKDGYIKVKPIL